MPANKTSDSTKQAILIAVSFIAFLVIGFVIFSAGEDEKDDKVKEYSSKHVDNGPYAQELHEYTKEIDLSSYGGDWEFGIVSQDFGSEAGVQVKSGKGMMVLYSACEELPRTYISSMVDEGDAIIWDEYGEDFNVCDGEVYVVRTADELEELEIG